MVGDVTETNNPTEDGTVATGNVGTVVSGVSIAITGVDATGSVGTVVQSKAVGLVGDEAVGQVGSATGFLISSRRVAR